MKFKVSIISLLVILFSISSVSAQSSSSKKSKNKNRKVVDLNTEKNMSVSLDDVLKKYKGQVVYLDFWASWCGPCKREMPYSTKLKDKLQDKDVAFVYISTDKNAASWEGMIDQLELKGDHYRASQKVKQEIVERFNLQYIPRYVLLNKEGKVADDNAKRPSDPAVLNDIDKLLL